MSFRRWIISLNCSSQNRHFSFIIGIEKNNFRHKNLSCWARRARPLSSQLDLSSTVAIFVFKRVDEHLLKREINKLKCSKSTGHDKIPVKIIKDAVNILSKPFAAIFNASLEEGVFPDAWKLAMITAIHK